ncbi:cytochrome P450 [Nocardioides panacihumi]|uniref:Cytochrome P450 n=1 Tax=Nocardioides panacihumi TaxID=400774 RepID=A0ABN2RJM8_9ACTN
MAGAESLASSPLNDLGWWLADPAEREATFARHRREDPRPFVRVSDRSEAGFWALTRHEDILEVSRRPEDFISGEGTQIFDQPAELRAYRGSIIDMDNPEHARLRKIVSRGFAVRSLQALRSDIEETVREIIAELPKDGRCDFVTDFAALLPLRIISNMLGVPREHEQFIFDATNVILGASDAEYIPDQTGAGIGKAVTAASVALIELLEQLAEDRIANPRDDVISQLVAAADDENLTPAEMAKFFILLVGAGNETTRNAITHGLLALTAHPEQRELWRSDYDAYAVSAVEEIFRWATPVIHFRRTVARDGVVLGDQEFRAGDKVVLWYNSGNRDETVFDDPYTFDITRDPNPHLAFGAAGPHFCLGAHLARLELQVVFKVLFEELSDIEAAGEPDLLRSNFLHGVKHLQATYTPR